MSQKGRGAEPSFLSGARLSGVLLRLSCERSRVQTEVARFGRFRLAADPDYPVDRLPVHCELWSVSDGALRFGGVDQHHWARRMGAAWGASMGALWDLAPIRRGVRTGEPGRLGRAAEWTALAASRATAASMGTYCELMVSVPGVIDERGDRSRPHALVLGMLTDSALARWADQTLGFGYRKKPATFRRDPRGGWNVSSEDGQPLVSVSRQVPPVRPAFLDVDRIDAIFQMPLLGSSRPGHLSRSWLWRSLRQPDAHVAPVAVSLDTSKALLGGVLPGRLEIPAYGGGEASGAIEFSNVEAWISYPTPA